MNRQVCALIVSLFLLSSCGVVAPPVVPTSSGSSAPSSPTPVVSASGSPTHVSPVPPIAVDSPSPTASVPGRRTLRTPPQGARWQIQYTGTLSIAGARIVDIDGAEATAATVATIHAAGAYAVCYINAGGWEDWRPDAAAFPAAVLGSDLDGWKGERWLDVRRLDVLVPIMAARMDDCAGKGFDAVDPDNVDGYDNDPGFPLSAADSLAYLRALTSAAHERGLAIGLKNATGLIAPLADVVDFAVNEQCVEYGECGAYAPLLARGKAVLHVEYTGTIADICASRPRQFSTVLKDVSLDARVQSCP